MVAEWVKHWPAEVVVIAQIPLEVEFSAPAPSIP